VSVIFSRTDLFIDISKINKSYSSHSTGFLIDVEKKLF